MLYFTAKGTRDHVRRVHFEDQQTLANRGDALKVLQQQGYDVQLVRCGKLYQLSTAKWYRVAGPSKRPVMLPQLQQGEVEAVGGRCPGR